MSNLSREVKAQVARIQSYINKQTKAAATELVAKYTTLMAKRYDEVVKTAAQRFYESYDPYIYRRTNALLDIHDIKASYSGNHGQVIINFKGTLPGHQSGAFIYDLVFKQGYHGGSIGTDRHGMSVSSPHYRTPLNEWTFWSRAAKRSTPPFEEIMEELITIDEELQAALDAEAEAKLNAIIKSIGL